MTNDLYRFTPSFRAWKVQKDSPEPHWLSGLIRGGRIWYQNNWHGTIHTIYYTVKVGDARLDTCRADEGDWIVYDDVMGRLRVVTNEVFVAQYQKVIDAIR